MFDAGLSHLLDELPDIEGLSPPEVRKLLTGAFLDILAIGDLGSASVDAGPNLEAARRAATALELHAVLGGDFSSEETRACAFVAAEALDLARGLSALTEDTEEERIGSIPAEQFAAMEASALYLIAGFDANAAVAARRIVPNEILEGPGVLAPAASRAAASVRSLFELKAPPSDPFPETPDEGSMAFHLRWEVFRRITASVDSHLSWLIAGEALADPSPAVELLALSDRLDTAGRFLPQSHLAKLLSAACEASEMRALRGVSGEGSEVWLDYVERRSRGRPLLWPAAQEYAAAVLHGEADHAVVNVPTGAGKSAVAELAIANRLESGWVLYLTPTNALAAQVVRDLEAQFGPLDDIEVKGFLGGAEYTELPGEKIENVQAKQILVMTPEKCSLALRQAPEAFNDLKLLVMDECHLVGDAGARGVTAELTISETLHRAPDVNVLFLSALVANPDELAGWISAATGRGSHVIGEPWRPTRTLRALLGIDAERANQPYEEAAQFLNENEQRRNAPFEAPVALLANLQGPWESLDSADYATVPAELSVPLVASRKSDGDITVQRTGYVNKATGRLTAKLAERDERVLAFLPANKHYSFSVADEMPDLEPKPRSNRAVGEVQALLDLADYELGAPSALRGLIEKGVGVHTSAMLRDEQRASELAFTNGQARALFATGTLAQGLNLPATAVVIGGTRVGDDRHLSSAAREEGERAQLLNAIGRAGRAYVASRSIGIVVPDRWIALRPDESPEGPRNRAPFLRYPDASTEVASRIQALIQTALDTPDVQIGQLTDEEEAAFTFLASSDSGDRQGVIRRSYGAFREGLTGDTARQVSETLDEAGRHFVESADEPDWIVEASHLSGVPLPAVGALHVAVESALSQGTPDSIETWREILIRTLAEVPPAILAGLLPSQPFRSTEMHELIEPGEAAAVSPPAIEALDEALALWMNGSPLTELSGPALGKDAGDSRRGSGHPLPKLITLTEHGFGFGLSRVAGALGALVDVAGTEDVELVPGMEDEGRRALDLLPIAVRFGCTDRGTVAWFRWGFRRRRVAHRLADLLPPPEDLDDNDLGSWIAEQRRALLSGELGETFDEEQETFIETLRAAPS